MFLQVRYIVDKFMDFRAKEKKRLEANPKFTIGNVTSVNLTRLYVSTMPFIQI